MLVVRRVLGDDLVDNFIVLFSEFEGSFLLVVLGVSVVYKGRELLLSLGLEH